ncbi:hypothetical protein [Polaromonas vacuolata]|nr:hypothetical protein [Polaromonas vacuolata]
MNALLVHASKILSDADMRGDALMWAAACVALTCDAVCELLA